MSSPASVQFRGTQKVLDAYDRRKVAAWAIFHRSQFMFKYEGNEMSAGENLLEQTLEMLKEDGNGAVYTLKVYEDLPPGGKLKSNTPDDGSFNFTVDGSAVGGVGDVGLRNELKTIRAELDQLKDGGASDSDSAIGKVREFLELPGMGEVLPMLVGKLFGDKAKVVVAGIANAVAQPDGPQVATPLVPDEFNDRIDNSLDEIVKVVPDIDKVLERLAQVAKANPEKLRNLTSMLNML